jgi:hypothetical protein
VVTIGVIAAMVSIAPARADDSAVALFFDSTETAYRIADHLYALDPVSYVKPPAREFVLNADDAHERLLSGTNPIVGMSLDDVISLVDDDDPRADDLTVIAGVHTGFLQLMTTADIADLPGLRAQRVAVDTDTGYASALFRILKSAGLQRDIDYPVVYAGATNVRYEKLIDGQFEATLLGAPFTDLALDRGFRSQGSVRDLLGGYQGIVLVTKRSWLAGHPEQARTAVASLLDAVQWAMDSRRRADVMTVVAGAVPGLNDHEDIATVTDTLFGPSSEYQPDGHLSTPGIAVVVDLYNVSRNRDRTVESVTDLIDYSFLPQGPS